MCFEIFFKLEHGTGKRRVQCDRCGLFMSVTSEGNPIFFTKHRDSEECKKEVRRNAKKPAKDALLPPCPPELTVSTHITKVEEHWMGVDSEKTKEYRELNEHFGVRNSDDHIFQEHQDTFEQRKGQHQAFPNSQTPLDSDSDLLRLMTIKQHYSFR